MKKKNITNSYSFYKKMSFLIRVIQMNSDFLSSRMQMKQSRQRQSNEQLTISKLKKNITNSYSFSKSPNVLSSCGTLNATQI